MIGWVVGSVLASEDLPRLSPQPQLVAGVKEPHFDLGGTWRFNPTPPDGFGSEISNLKSKMPAGWTNIQVPGQWLQQGFTVDNNKAAGYCRTFIIPADWKDKRIKLRCDAVYSDTTIWIAGKEIGKHLGGFTPFEFDVTDAVKPGSETTIALSVQSSSVADKLASGMQYAAHDLGGISRKIYLMAVPAVHIASLHVRTTFDAEFKNAELALDLTVANDGAELTAPSSVSLVLRDPRRQEPARPTLQYPLSNRAKSYL